ncbi:MAG: EAL domain-containing protein [Pseudolabrys sp.]|nr:EAL domain-containing protein [Pseudolabrys sp.]
MNPNLKPVSLRAVVTIIALFVAIVTAIGVPAGYFYVAYSGEGQALQFKAQLKAGRLAKYIYANNNLWQYHTVRLTELIEAPEANDPEDQKRVYDASRKMLLEVGPSSYPALTRSAPIVINGTKVGDVEVSASAAPILKNTAIVAGLSCLLGFGMFFAVRVFPLRVLNRTLGALAVSQEALKDQNRRFDAALNNMSQGLIMFGADERVVVCNEQYIRMYDLDAAIVKPGCLLIDLLRHRTERGRLCRDPEAHRSEVLEKHAFGLPFTVIVEAAAGQQIAIANQPMAGGGWVATHEDITERRKAEATITHMALHDALTDLPNRSFFKEQMQLRLEHLARNEKFAVLCLDLDRFKNVNDTLGHPSGDKLLRLAADRMSACLGEGDTIARLGGDEFAVLQGNQQSPDETIALVERLIAAIETPFDLDGHQAIIGVSVGIAVAPTDATNSDQLLKSADMALYRAKAERRGTYRFFESEMDARMQARRTLELGLRKALRDSEFEVYYQPLINLLTEEIAGFEALVRWHHPERGLVPPLEFIPLAEDTMLIVPIGEWVLRQACKEAMNWPDDISVAVNLSPMQFKMPNLTQTVMSALAHSGLPPRRLELEITESVLLIGTDATLTTLHQLRSLGVRISMDDFGTGYSSLSYLRSFPFDKIKLDQSFVHNLEENEDSKAIIRAIGSLGASLGMTTTGEGVETQIELDYLKGQGFTEAQGYLFSRPGTAVDARALLAKRLPNARAVA